MNIRLLSEIEEFEKCIDLQRASFGASDIDAVPPRLLKVLSQIGGAVFGAFEGDRLVAFLSTIPGIRNGKPYWHSQMLAVDPSFWNSGVGASLKLFQRNEALARGIGLIEWTFDPLESKNAYLNIVKLGAIVRRYYVNHYGSVGFALYRGLESDRVVAEWWIQKPRVIAAGENRRVVVPADLQSLKKTDLAVAQEVRQRVRREFLQNIKDDFFVVGFERKGDTSEYIFVRGAADVHSND